MIYVFDIDGTICTNTNGNYNNAEPFRDRIEKNNKLYNEGHTVIYHTARGMGRNFNIPQVAIEQFQEFTEEQLKSWGVKYHELFLGKPSGDIYVDDKGLEDKRFYGD